MSEPLPEWLIDSRLHIEGNQSTAGGAMNEPPDGDTWDRGYWCGYYDACRHALKALPPYLAYPDDEDLVFDEEATDA